MDTRDHPHVTRTGDMIRCTVCHRQWSADERGDEVPPCQPVHDERIAPVTKPAKHQGWRGPGDHGKTSRRTSRYG
jgi:hypothetical protein